MIKPHLPPANITGRHGLADARDHQRDLLCDAVRLPVRLLPSDLPP